MPGTTPVGAAAQAGTQRPQQDWETSAHALLNEGQNFLAHDTCREGLKAYPDSHKLAITGAIALSQTGAVEEARRLLQPVLDVLLVDESPFRRLEGSLRQAMDLVGRGDNLALAAVAELAEALDLVRGKKLVATADSDTYTSLARVFREAWWASGERRDLELCRELYLRAFKIGGEAEAGVDAATMSWLLGDLGGARELAGRALRAPVGDGAGVGPAERYRRLATRGHAQLLLGDAEAALGTFAQAAALEGVGYPEVVNALKQLELLKDGGMRVPSEITELVRPPRVVVFTGHPLDRPGEGPHFPPELEGVVRGEISRTLDELDAQVGYSMAACGSDLLFIEAMLERGAEVNVVMPFAQDDFIAQSVRYAGPRWEMRFRNALKLAASVTYATEERYLGHEMLYRFANQCLHGLATLRAGFLRTSPTLLAVWDMMPGSLVGGAGDFIDQWEDISRLRMIDLDGLLQQHPDLAAKAATPSVLAVETGPQVQGRVIRSVMFCDIAGYSKLKEEHVPVFLEFLALLRRSLSAAGIAPGSINTWGDAIFAVMDRATPMAEYALTLQEAVLRADEELGDRLPHPLSLRISLHAGPVFEAIDPICGRRNYYGSHINRAARLEPVTVIGHVYATQQFVAVLTAEQSALRAEAASGGAEFEDRYVCEYVGVQSLAKDFGRQVVYHLRRVARIEDTAAEDFPAEDLDPPRPGTVAAPPPPPDDWEAALARALPELEITLPAEPEFEPVPPSPELPPPVEQDWEKVIAAALPKIDITLPDEPEFEPVVEAPEPAADAEHDWEVTMAAALPKIDITLPDEPEFEPVLETPEVAGPLEHDWEVALEAVLPHIDITLPDEPEFEPVIEAPELLVPAEQDWEKALAAAPRIEITLPDEPEFEPVVEAPVVTPAAEPEWDDVVAAEAPAIEIEATPDLGAALPDEHLEEVFLDEADDLPLIDVPPEESPLEAEPASAEGPSSESKDANEPTVESVLAAVARMMAKADAAHSGEKKERKPKPVAPPPPPPRPADPTLVARVLEEGDTVWPGG